MPEQFDLNEILSRNPGIDPERLKEAREMLRRLRDSGTRRKGYDLAPPFGGQRASVRDDARPDRRLVRLRHPPDRT